MIKTKIKKHTHKNLPGHKSFASIIPNKGSTIQPNACRTDNQATLTTGTNFVTRLQLPNPMPSVGLSRRAGESNLGQGVLKKWNILCYDIKTSILKNKNKNSLLLLCIFCLLGTCQNSWTLIFFKEKILTVTGLPSNSTGSRCSNDV